jgi:hypothetical protein
LPGFLATHIVCSACGSGTDYGILATRRKSLLSFPRKLQERLRRVGVACELVYPGAPDVKHPRAEDFLIEQLTAGKG